MTYFELYLKYLKHYNKKDNPNKNQDFYNLLFHHSKKIRTLSDFFLYKNQPIDFQNRLGLFLNDLKLLGKYHFPVAYLTNKHYFYGRKFFIHKGALIPRSETELLVDKITLENYQHNLKILDLCAGIGVIGLSLAANLKAQVTMVEKQSIPVRLCKQNAKLLLLNHHAKILHCTMQNFLRITKQKFDIVVMNPPYIDYRQIPEWNVLKYEPKNALFAKNHGLYFYQFLLRFLPKLIKEKILVYLEIDNNQKALLTKFLENIWWRKHFEIHYEFSCDYHNFTRFLKIEIKRK